MPDLPLHPGSRPRRHEPGQAVLSQLRVSVSILAGWDEAHLVNGLCRSSLGRPPGDEVQVRLYDRHRVISPIWVDGTFVIKLGVGDDHNAAIRKGPVNARGDSRRSGRNYDGVGAEDPIKIRNASRRQGWWRKTSTQRKGLSSERRVAGQPWKRERRSARCR